MAIWLLYLRQTEFSVLSTRERDAADWIVVHDVKTFMSSSLESESSPTIVCVCACRELRMKSFFGPVARYSCSEREITSEKKQHCVKVGRDIYH